MGESEQQLDEVRARLAELPADGWLGGTAARPTNGNGSGAHVESEPEASAEAEAVSEPEAAAEAEAVSGPEPAAEAEAAPEPEAAAEAEAAPEPGPAKTDGPATAPTAVAAGRRVRPILLGLLALAAIVIVIALVAGGGDDEPASPAASGGQESPVQPGGTGSTEGARLTPVGSAAPEATGTARLTDDGERLELEVRGLPELDGRDYVVWLYSSVIDSRNLGNFRGTQIELDAELPDDWKRYRFLDVSIEPRDGKPTVHSGESVMRVPTRRLVAR
jgi:hypothetical protein